MHEDRRTATSGPRQAIGTYLSAHSQLLRHETAPLSADKSSLTNRQGPANHIMLTGRTRRTRTTSTRVHVRAAYPSIGSQLGAYSLSLSEDTAPPWVGRAGREWSEPASVVSLNEASITTFHQAKPYLINHLPGSATALQQLLPPPRAAARCAARRPWPNRTPSTNHQRLCHRTSTAPATGRTARRPWCAPPVPRT